MTKSSLDLLRKLVREVNDSQTVAEKMQALSRAFELFTEETTRLELAYVSLQEQFETVNKQLQGMNNKLKEKVLELDITNDYLENILSNMAQGLLFINSNGKMTTYNAAAEALLGLDKSQVLHQDFIEVFGDQFFGFSMKQALESADAPKMTFATLPVNEYRPSVREIEVETSFVLKSNDKKQNSSPPLDVSMGLIILLRDITEIRRLQSIADRNDRLKDLGEMAAMVAHEIRNPLGGIKGFASLLVRDLKDSPHLQEMASYIVEGTDSLNKLVTNILNYSRPLQIVLQSTDLVSLIKELAQHIRVDSSVKENIEIVTDLPKHPVFGQVDSQLFKSCLLNLVVNSIHALPNGGKIILSLKVENSHIIVQVRDNGEGIPKENMEKIFRPFFTTKPRGHGFGLAEVHRVVQAHNGEILVDSIVKEGSTFTIKIPFLKMDNPHSEI